MRLNHNVSIMFVTNFCPHYRVGAFEALSQKASVRFYFSDPQQLDCERKKVARGDRFDSVALGGFYLLPKLRVSPGLIWRLLVSKYDIVIKCTNDRFAFPVTYLLTRLRGKKFILWQTMWSHPKMLFHRLTRPILKTIWKDADAIVVYGPHGKKYLEQLGIESQKIFIAWQSVDNSKFNGTVSLQEIEALRTCLDVGLNHIVLYVGRLVEDKGVEILLQAEALLSHQPHALVFVGDGDLKDRLKRECSRLGLKNVRFAGSISQEHLPTYYAAARVFVLPSITTAAFKEPWGLVVNEAMNQGCPAVVTDAVGAGAGGLVQDGVNGFIVPERNPGELASAIEKILRDDQLSAQMRTHAAQMIKQWTFSRWAEGFVDAISYVTPEHSD
jgi:glycosyltransferase involved in cell wall biosynthesis